MVPSGPPLESPLAYNRANKRCAFIETTFIETNKDIKNLKKY